MNRWQPQDHYFRRAKKEGFPARSVYKLEEIDRRVRLFRPGQRVLDLGCHPGSWLQYCARAVGHRGLVVGVDLRPMALTLPSHVQVLQADVFGLPGVTLSVGEGPAVQGLKLVEVRPEEDELFRTWNELIETEHPLRDGRMVGRQLRYLIGSDHGWMGAVGFGSCALRLANRDEWIGWDEPMRRQYQDRVLDMRRFLIRPSVRCENLASRVLSMVAKRVAADFERRYRFEPWLLESFVNTEAYEGTCYQAANWLCVGESIGRGRNGPIVPTVPRKDVYVYELNRRWRRQMGSPASGTCRSTSPSTGRRR